MASDTVQLSKEFKTQAFKAILAIVFFVVSYLVLFLLAIGLTVLCGYMALFLIKLHFSIILLIFGIGLGSLGVMVLMFLLKFSFKSHKVDRSHLYEIKRVDEPHLFNLIDEVVSEVRTSFPKKVYLSSDINASVFYNSGFWSMFFPVRKNLQIGIGLVNTISHQELKAVLAHEFGHFSQSTMKVGSYVYNVNQIIFNMLFENDSFDEYIEKWANLSNYLAVFVIIAVQITKGLQFILKQLYIIVNKSYMALSREMEFHADEIATNVTGYEPLKNVLLRMPLAEHALENVFSFYNEKIPQSLKSENVFIEQNLVMDFIARRNNFRIENKFPIISLEEQSKFDKSKLVFKDQWASHPSTRERIERMELKGFSKPDSMVESANTLFSDCDKVQRMFTDRIFSSVTFPAEAIILTPEEFDSQYSKNYLDNAFSELFNGYYDNKDPLEHNFDSIDLGESPDVALSDLFSDHAVDLVYSEIALQSDIQTLKGILTEEISVRTFDYDGKKYKRMDSPALIKSLEKELDALKNTIQNNDISIYKYFYNIESKLNVTGKLKEHYSQYFEFEKEVESRFALYNNLVNGLQFTHVKTPFEDIEVNILKIKPLEREIKSDIKKILSNSLFTEQVDSEIKLDMERYADSDLKYFNGSKYLDENLNILYSGVNAYLNFTLRTRFLLKKNLLAYKAELISITGS